MFSKENLDFHFPLFITSIHMLVQFSLAALVLFLLPQFRPQRPQQSAAQAAARGEYAQLNEHEEEQTPKPEPGRPQPLMTPWFYLSRIAPCGTATALDIGLGNFSMRFISLTFYTMCKSSVLAFVLLFAFLFRLEKPTVKLCAVISVMTVGVILMVAGETAFSGLGFALVMIASFCSGFRWSLTQILLLRNPATSNPFSSILFLTPVMFIALFALALPIEGPVRAVAGFRALCDERGTFMSTLLLLFPGTLAFMMVAAEFALIKRTSVVTLSVCGIFKEVLTISAASLTFGDSLSPINISGLVVTIVAIAAYNVIKYGKMKKEARKEAHRKLEGEEPAAGGPLGAMASDEIAISCPDDDHDRSHARES
jgi:solute carrier family 35 protein C2